MESKTDAEMLMRLLVDESPRIVKRMSDWAAISLDDLEEAGIRYVQRLIAAARMSVPPPSRDPLGVAAGVISA